MMEHNQAVPAAHDVLVQLQRVTKRFGQTTAIDQLNGAFRAGHLTGLIGPDGAGKTTLLRMLAGLMAADQGTISVVGCDPITDGAQLSGLIGYMPQQFGLYEDLSVAENLRLYAALRGLSQAQRRTVFDDMYAFTRLEPFQHRLAGRLSGGMKQKLGLACALMARPRVLLLDEPSVGVDPVSRQELWRMVHALTDGGMAVIWATSYLDEAERCHEVLLLNEGRLQYAGVPQALTQRLTGRCFLLPVHDEQQRRPLLTQALSCVDVVDGVLAGNALRLVISEHSSRNVLDDVVASAGTELSATEARFEDAFIDLLGGGPGGVSPLTKQMAAVSLTAQPVIACSHLTRCFGDFVATDDVTFLVNKGQIFGLLGPNGAGKSTTFKMLCGLLQPSSGTALVLGKPLRDAALLIKRQLGYMAQKFSLYGLLSVQQNLNFYAGIYGLSGVERKQRVQQMIDTFELTPYLAAAPQTLPLGFRQRLALACALMHQPAVLFLDEPTSGVDPLTRREFWTHINALVSKGVTVLITTHFMDEAEYCDQVALMFEGRVIAQDAPAQLKQQVASSDCPAPTMEQAFIRLIEARQSAPVKQQRSAS